MFRHETRLQYDARPDRPDAAFAKLLQEVLAGQASETTAMMQYLYQGCNCRGPAKYRDMLMATAAEEVGHVEMVATMIARLLEKAPVTDQEAAAAGDPATAAVMGGMHPQHFLTAGLSALPRDSAGNPWNAAYVWGTGNLLADFRANVALESLGRLTLCRSTSSATTRACATCSASSSPATRCTRTSSSRPSASSRTRGWRRRPCRAPSRATRSCATRRTSSGTSPTAPPAADGAWASGKTPDGRGKFEFLERPKALGGAPSSAPPTRAPSAP
jgi:Mn-containing catalase